MSTIILSKVSDVTIELSPESVSERDLKLAVAREITAITDGFHLEIAVDSVRELSSILKLAEKTRTEVKAPVLDLGRRIDTLAKEFIADVEKESRRLNGLVNAYQVEERRKRDAEEAERRKEAERIEAEKREAQRKIDEAKSAEERKARQAEAAKIEQSKPVQIVAPAFVPEGVKTKKVWRFEITDIQALAKASPELVRIEGNIIEIRKKVDAGMRSSPGLRIWEETQTQIR